MRLFVAVRPPAPVLDDVERAVAPVRAAWPTLRWVRRDLWHITLAFLGEVDEQAAARLPARLARAAARHPRLALAFAGAGAFPNTGARGRVLWLGVRGDDVAELARLAASAAAGARRAGVPGDEAGRPFHAHLTLARCRQPTDLRAAVAALSPYAGAVWTVETIELMRSHLGSDMRYEIVGSWPLAERSAPPGAGGP